MPPNAAGMDLSHRQHKHAHFYGTVPDRSLSLKVARESVRIGDEMTWIVHDTPERVAIWMFSVVLDVDNELFAHFSTVSSITNKLQLEDDAMRRQKKVHPRTRPGVARCEFLWADIRDPRPKESVKKVLDVVL